MREPESTEDARVAQLRAELSKARMRALAMAVEPSRNDHYIALLLELETALFDMKHAQTVSTLGRM